MSRAIRAWSWAALGATLACAAACQRGSASHSDQGYPAPSSSGLDGMQLSSARRVALESATAAMKRRDLGRLKQLSLWVKNRAQVAILEPDDQQALDLAIQCLEQVGPTADTLASIEQLKSGRLKQPARELCAGPAAP